MIHVLELPHRDARALLRDTGAPVFLFVNPVEYHGPHLSLRNDALLAAGLAKDLHARLQAAHPGWPFLTAGELGLGCDVTPGAGAVETRYPLLRRLVVDACRALADLGARRVVLMSFHGSPNHSHALQAGARLLARRGVQALAPLNVVLHELLALDDGAPYAEAFAHVDDPAERAALVRELPHDFHAGFFETSLSLHYAPHTVSDTRRELPPCPPLRPARGLALAGHLARVVGARRLARELAYVATGAGWYALRPFPGYTGRPALASAAAGAYFAREIVERQAAAALAVLGAGASAPRPVLGWLPTASLGGRLGPRVPLSAWSDDARA
ncbi:MAG: creatininase family protein [Planctomycetes bacterium]|nr:creatininase family protein [Planctomycetota bacterium]